MSLDARFAAIDSAVPGFAGFWYDSAGSLVVNSTAFADRGRLRAIIETEPAASLGDRPRQLLFRTVTHRFVDLANWYGVVTRLHLAGLVMTDIDEVHNRIAIGVESPWLAEKARTAITLAQIPTEAIEVHVQARVVPTADLKDYVRPVMGGLQVENYAKYCTLGFWVRLAYPGDYFVTNSHCTQNLFYLDPWNPIRQPTYWTDQFFGNIGAEYRDPPLRYDWPDCDEGTYCRYSDAAVFQYTTSSFTHNIARTSFLSVTPGTLGGTTLLTPYFNVAGELPSSQLVVGQGLNKVGRTSGWTAGQITATCVRAYQPGYYLDCQYEASSTVAGGDSGSPVFQFFGGPTGYDVDIAGLLWGRTDSLRFDPVVGAVGGHYVFSPLWLIRYDMGGILTVTP